MIIRFVDLELAGTGREGVGDFTLNGQRVVDPQEFIGAANASIVGRGNASRTVEFSVTREHENTVEASFHLLEHEDELPDEGTLVFNMSESGSGGATITIENAVLLKHAATQRGVSTFHRYSFAFGGINV